jgi:hypothetical protein
MSADARWRVGVVGILVACGAVLLWSVSARRASRPPFPAKIELTYLGRTGMTIAGKGNVVGIDGEADVGFRIGITPTKNEGLTILGVVVFSSDRAGRLAGGGRWDTYDESTRALALTRDGNVVNTGPKRMLSIDVAGPTTLVAHFADGTMTTFWKYFTVRIEAAGGYTHSIVIENRRWHLVQRT